MLKIISKIIVKHVLNSILKYFRKAMMNMLFAPQCMSTLLIKHCYEI